MNTDPTTSDPVRIFTKSDQVAIEALIRDTWNAALEAAAKAAIGDASKAAIRALRMP